MFKQANDMIGKAAQAIHFDNITRVLGAALLPRDRQEMAVLVWCPPAYVAIRSADAAVNGFFPKPPAATQDEKPEPMPANWQEVRERLKDDVAAD